MCETCAESWNRAEEQQPTKHLSSAELVGENSHRETSNRSEQYRNRNQHRLLDKGKVIEFDKLWRERANHSPHGESNGETDSRQCERALHVAGPALRI